MNGRNNQWSAFDGSQQVLAARPLSNARINCVKPHAHCVALSIHHVLLPVGLLLPGVALQAKSTDPIPDEEAIQRVLMCLQTVLGADLKASEVEVVYMKRGETYQVIADDVVDHHLTVIAERD